MTEVLMVRGLRRGKRTEDDENEVEDERDDGDVI
jgi:hypothetical protein